MLSQKEVDDLIRSMGRVFPRKHGWSYSIISPSETFEESFGRKADKRRKLYNGMIKCQLYFTLNKICILLFKLYYNGRVIMKHIFIINPTAGKGKAAKK